MKYSFTKVKILIFFLGKLEFIYMLRKINNFPFKRFVLFLLTFPVESRIANVVRLVNK